MGKEKRREEKWRAGDEEKRKGEGKESSEIRKKNGMKKWERREGGKGKGR